MKHEKMKMRMFWSEFSRNYKKKMMKGVIEDERCV